MKQKKDELLDHDADGIREYDNALPRWWLYGFYLTIIYGILYLVNFYVLPQPLIGLKDQFTEYQQEVEYWKNAPGHIPKADLANVVVLTDAASMARGKEIFEGTDNLCFTCHRPDLGGQVGPDLTDEYWIHGCSPKDIITSITTGFPEKGMLPYGSTNKLSDEDLLKVASYIISKRGSKPADPKPREADRELECTSSTAASL